MGIETPAALDNPIAHVKESEIDELLYEHMEADSPTESYGNMSMYIVFFCTFVVLFIFAYQLIRLIVRIKEGGQDRYLRHGSNTSPLLKDNSRVATPSQLSERNT